MSLTRRDANNALGRQGRGGSHQKTAPLPVFHGVSQLKEYTIDKKLGQGTFGIVFKGVHNRKRHYVAIKQILQRVQDSSFPVTAFREISILKALRDSDNIVELIEVIFDVLTPDLKSYIPGNTYKTGQSMFMVFPYMAYDLTGILQSPTIELREADRKSIMQQLFQGIDYIHQNKFLHRDIKASNILINHNGLLKIADFGLAREYHGPKPSYEHPGGGTVPLTEVVMTRWYRAPEVLFGDRLYTTAVDLWGIGCVLGELYEKEPILRGTSDLDQSYIIFKLCGSPREETRRFPEWKKKNNANVQYGEGDLNTRFSRSMPPDGRDLLQKLLTVDFKKRITTRAALEHEWFKSHPLASPRVQCTFPECHEADAIRLKEEKKAKSKNNGQPTTGNNGYLPKELTKQQPINPHGIPPKPASIPPRSLVSQQPPSQIHSQSSLQPPPQLPYASQHPQPTSRPQHNGPPPFLQGSSHPQHYSAATHLPPPPLSQVNQTQDQKQQQQSTQQQAHSNGHSQQPPSASYYPTKQRYHQKDRYQSSASYNNRANGESNYYQSQSKGQPQQPMVVRSNDNYADYSNDYPHEYQKEYPPQQSHSQQQQQQQQPQQQHHRHHNQRKGYQSNNNGYGNNHYNGSRPYGYGPANGRGRDYYHDREDNHKKRKMPEY